MSQELQIKVLEDVFITFFPKAFSTTSSHAIAGSFLRGIILHR